MNTEIACPNCNEENSLIFKRDSKRYGFCYNITLSCTRCLVQTSQNFSSRRSAVKQAAQPFVVNDIVVLLFNQLGLGHAAMKKFSCLFGWEGLHLKTFQSKESKIISTIIDNTEDVLTASVAKVKEAHVLMDPTVSTNPLCITVSFDGSWQKRGHTSLYGFAAVIDVLTGLVVDYVILSKYCHSCSIKKSALGENSEAFQTWFQRHKEQCAINYSGSSNAMEVEAACRLWKRSEERHGLQYTGFLSDGDSKAYKAVTELNLYPEEVVKEECLNHAHKRMGTALINLSKQKRLGGHGYGRLTKEKAIKFQYYYRGAIKNNIGDSKAMRRAVWASLFHCMSTDESPQHDRCSAKWCFYLKALESGDPIPPHKGNIRHPLAPSVGHEMLPIYERMTDTNLLQRMEKGQTQNANECLHSVIWSRCSKTMFVGKHKLHGAAASAVCSFNEGAIHLTQVMDKMAIEYNEVINCYIEELDRRRVAMANAASSALSRKDRSDQWLTKRGELLRLEAQEGPSYVSGGF